MTLIDTSVWIDFLAGRNTPQVNVLESLIEQREELCLCGVVLTEILQGIRDQEEFIKTESILSNLILLPAWGGRPLSRLQIFTACFVRVEQQYETLSIV